MGTDSDVYVYANRRNEFHTHIVKTREPRRNKYSFVDFSLKDLKRRLLNLRKKGYVIPDDTFERIEHEIRQALVV